MATGKSKWLKLFAITSATFACALASAQYTPQDWPTLKANSGRTGINYDVGPGLTNLRWWTPANANNETTTSFIIDNTYTAAGNTNGIFGFPTPFGTNAWNPSPLPGTNSSDAAGPYLVYDGNGNAIDPAYVTALGTQATGNPTVANTGTASRAQWIFNNLPAIAASQKNMAEYALYVWLPVGPQFPTTGEQFPERYFVYQINAGGRTFTDIVDTYASGGGWVRLGNGGLPTNMVFPWDGTNAPTITLFNTFPIDSSGNPYPNCSSSQLVYADAAMAVPTSGYYVASPVSAAPANAVATPTRVIGANNQLSTGGALTAALTTVVTGVVTSYQYDQGTPIWSYSPVETTGATTTLNTGAASGAFANAPAGTTTFSGAPEQATIITGTNPTGQVTYTPTGLPPGTYLIYAYLPGNNNGQLYGDQVNYEIDEGNTATTLVAVNQQAAAGWVLIGTRRFENTVAEPLDVRVTNTSSDPTDVGKSVYTDAIRFVAEQSHAVNSTPLIANINLTNQGGGGTTPTQVVVVADENGVIHCLDYTGNPDGTTNEYWEYPNPNDPDTNTAAQPANFDLSSALIVPNIPAGTGGTTTYLYIASQNGRVYCFDMAGDGKFTRNANNNDVTNPGTATRVWTYPATGVQSKLGAIEGSLAYSDTSNNGGTGDTIYVPTPQGRLYALNALTGAIRWTYPQLTKPTLGPIYTTPAIQASTATSPGKVFFGSSVNPVDDSGGLFFALNAATGLPVWQYPAANTTPFATMLDYHSSPAYVPWNVGGPSVSTSTTSGLVYALNQNQYVIAFDSETGVNTGTNAPWFYTNELGVGGTGSLSFSPMSVFANTGLPVPNTPCLQIPTSDGRFDAMFSDPNTTNQYATNSVTGSRRAFEFVTEGTSVIASLANSNAWMFGADMQGFLYAFNTNTGSLSPGNSPGYNTIVENNPLGAIFRNAKVKLINQAGYNQLRLPTGQNLTYQQGTSSTYNFTRSPLAFEWGETMYVMVYDFPDLLLNNANQGVAPPVVNVTISSGGKSIRTIAVEARAFNPSQQAPDDPDDPNFPNGTETDNGYAILAFPFQGGGNQSIPPGSAMISVSISSSALNNNGTQQRVALNPNLANFSILVANPLALAMPLPNGTFTDVLAIGDRLSPSDIENLVDGSPFLNEGGGSTKNTSLLGQSAGVGQHGGAVTAPVFVIDRSMMALLRPDNTGLDGVRVDVRNLAWEGTHLAIYKPLNQSVYTNFEDLPDNFPNTSFDYPDIQSEQVVVTKDPNGTAENPRFNSVALLPALFKDPSTGATRPLQPGDDPLNRQFQNTLVNFTVNIPRFQPANTIAQVTNAGAAIANSAGVTTLDQGYLGRVRVFVDSNSNGILDTSPEEAYRSFNLMNAVDIDEKLVVTTPTVDLGTLAEATGYSPAAPGTAGSTFTPWGGGNFSGLFQPFVVENQGNVNLLNVRLAKGSLFPPAGSPTPVFTPWGFYSTDNDLLGFVDGAVDLWSDIDTTFAPPGNGQTVVFQKSRVGDVSPAQLSPNPRRRANSNLGTTGSATDTLNDPVAFPPGPPHIAVSIPLGMPAGSYSNLVRVIEKSTGGQIWQDLAGTLSPETFSDPTLTLNFKVREAQLTNTFTANTAPMIDNLGGNLPNANQPLWYGNKQPAMIRDQFGGLIVAWASDRGTWAPTQQPTQESQLGKYALFIATVGNTAINNSGYQSPIDPQSPLTDLNSFTPNGGRWFNQVIAAYPTTPPDTLFGSLAGQAVIPSTVVFGNPSFPVSGLHNPYNPSGFFTAMFMPFTGSAQKQTGEGRIGESKIFMATLTPGAGGNVTITGSPVVMANDPQVGKGKPSMLQTSTGGMLFYGGSTGSASSIYYSVYGNSGGGAGFGPSIALPFGGGFASVSDPSAAGRIYNGVGSFKSDGVTPILRRGDNMVELTFAGQLHGRPSSEIFIGRMKLDPNLLVVVDDQGNRADSAQSDGNVFVDMSPVTNEPIVQTGQQGEYRALGVDWERTSSIQLWQILNGAQLNLLIDGTGLFDRETGLISYDSRLGGKVYFDPALGTVRFPSAAPSKSAQLLLSYTPRFLRLSVGVGAGFTKPVGSYDNRLTSNTLYWRRPAGQPADFTDAILNDRYVFTYNRAAGGAGLPPRPYTTTLRLGVQLSHRIATDATGTPIVTVQGTVATGYYQIDAANGRIYFEDSDEDNHVTVTYNALLENGQTQLFADSGVAGLLTEEPEQQILIDNALNEADLTSFLDPFSFMNQRRPPMLWLLWTSARGGIPDLYMETISPQWNPVINSPN